MKASLLHNRVVSYGKTFVALTRCLQIQLSTTNLVKYIHTRKAQRKNPLAQVLYAAVHPRWTVGFALSCSLRSRKKGLKRATLGEVPHAYQNDYFDVEKEWLVRWTKAYAAEHPEIDYYLFGHRHLLIDLALRGDKRIVILGDWLQYNSFAVWDGTSLFVDQFIEDEA